MQYTSCLPRDYKGVDEDGAEGVDEEVQPVEEMAMKIPVAAAPGGQRPLAPSSSLNLVLVWRRFSPSLEATKERDFRHNGCGPPKVGFPLNI